MAFIASRLVRYSPDLNVIRPTCIGALLADWYTFTDIVSIRTPTLLPTLCGTKATRRKHHAKPIKHASYIAMKASVT